MEEKSIFDKDNAQKDTANETNSEASDFYNLPQEYKDMIGAEYLKQFREFNPQVQEEDITRAMQGYSKYYEGLNEDAKKQELASLKDTNAPKAERVREILKKGDVYYNNSQWGRIERLGGLQNYANKADELIAKLTEENENLKKGKNIFSDEKAKKEYEEKIAELQKNNEELQKKVDKYMVNAKEEVREEEIQASFAKILAEPHSYAEEMFMQKADEFLRAEKEKKKTP